MFESVATASFHLAQAVISWMVITCGALGILLACLVVGDELFREILNRTDKYFKFYEYYSYRTEFKAWLKEKGEV